MGTIIFIKTFYKILNRLKSCCKDMINFYDLSINILGNNAR